MSASSPSGRRTPVADEHLDWLIRSWGSALVADEPSAEYALAQLDERWEAIVLPRDVDQADDVTLRADLHAAAQHLHPRGRLAAIVGPVAPRRLLDLGAECELEAEACTDCGDAMVVVQRRSGRFNVHDLVFEARRTIRRYDPEELAGRLAGRDAPLVLDTRTHTDRQRFGVIAGSVHAPRTVLEWHLDPANGYQLREVRDLDQPLVVVCNGGYSSSLAAANLVRLGFSDVGDLRGGVHAWKRAGLPLVEPDHSHLDAPQ